MEKQDLRVVKTNKYIRQALVDLLSEKSFREIAVNDILEKAMINRTTFYRYYSGKADLAGKMIADLKQTLAQAINERLTVTDLDDFYERVIPPIFEERRQVLALWKVETSRLHLWRDMGDMIKALVLQILRKAKVEPDYLDYQATIFSSMVMESIRYHFERDLYPDPKLTSEKMIQALEIVNY